MGSVGLIAGMWFEGRKAGVILSNPLFQHPPNVGVSSLNTVYFSLFVKEEVKW